MAKLGIEEARRRIAVLVPDEPLDLKSLHLTTADIDALAAEMVSCTWVDLSHNPLHQVPESLRQMRQLKYLRLVDIKLRALPAWLGELTSLETLILYSNELGELPNLVNLDNLKELDISFNPIGTLPEWLGDMNNLVELELFETQLTELPEWIDKLTNLETLELSQNSLTHLPSTLFNLKNLARLDLERNLLTTLPDWIGGMSSLNSLDVSNNVIKTLPEGLSRLKNLAILRIGGNRMGNLPEWLVGMSELILFDVSNNMLQTLPNWIGELAKINNLDVSSNPLHVVPECIGNLTSLRRLSLRNTELHDLPGWMSSLTLLETLDISLNPMEVLPECIGELGQLTDLDINGCTLTQLPTWIGNLTKLTDLIAANNVLVALPQSAGRLQDLDRLDIADNNFTQMPDCIGNLAMLTSLDVSQNRLESIPEWFGNLRNLSSFHASNNWLSKLPECMRDLVNLKMLVLYDNQLSELPEWMGNFAQITHLDISDNFLRALPDSIGNLWNLEHLDLANNRLAALPDSIGRLPYLVTILLTSNSLCNLPLSLADSPSLATLSVIDNPLSPEVVAAAGQDNEALLEYLRLLATDGQQISEAKLVLVGEGKAGKSSLLGALRGDEFIEDRVTTHGIEIKPVELHHGEQVITLNGWDFGGQKIYRPTHQLFFTHPAVYLVVWEPRQGPELGQVREWMTMIRHRAGGNSRVHIVATHGGPGQRYAHIDQSALREEFGDMIVDFHHIDSLTKFGIPELAAAIAATAAEVPHVTRMYPRSWLRLRKTITSRSESFLRYDTYEALALSQGLSPLSSKSLASNANELGYWIHYADEPDLADLVILKPDWLSAAIGFVLEDPETNIAGGLLPHRRLGHIWSDPNHPEHQYPHWQQQMFLRLMELADLTYRAEQTGAEPISIVAQLVPSSVKDASNVEPDVPNAWVAHRPDAAELYRVCQIVERDTGRATTPEGLIPRLIVLFHKHSLGRHNVADAVHWTSGMVLQDRYDNRALLTLAHDGVRVRARGLNPEPFLDRLTHDIRDSIELFWPGLTTRLLIPCQEPCGLGAPGRGLFDYDQVLGAKSRNKSDMPCTAFSCNTDMSIDALLHGMDSPEPNDEMLRSVLKLAMGLQTEILSAMKTQQETQHHILTTLEDFGDKAKTGFSQMEGQLIALQRALDDDGAEGPRLFTLEPIERSLTHRDITAVRMRLTLWCEHSRLPVRLLEEDQPNAGIYTVTISRDWWVKAQPVIKITSIALKAILPVSLAATELNLSDKSWATIKEDLNLDKELLSATADIGKEVSSLSGDKSAGESAAGKGPVYAEGGLLRSFHAALKEQDITFADLRRVRDDHNRWIWVHKRFVHIYQPPPPTIPT